MSFNNFNLPDYVKIVINPYGNKFSKNRKGIMVNGPWIHGLCEYIKKENIAAVYLNVSKGWSGNDYKFLENLSSIQELDIIAGNCTGLESLECLSSLKELSITCATRSVVDFKKLNNLEECYLYWWTGASSIFEALSLRKLYLDEVKVEDYSPLGNLFNLNSLTLANSNIIDLNCIPSLELLRELKVLNCRKLINFSGLSRLKGLKELVISGSKSLKDLFFLKNLPEIEILDISDNGEILSLEPVCKLYKLKALAFSGSTNILDGDLSCLAELNQLSMLMFAQRKHYTHKLIKKWDWKNFNNPDVLLEEI